MIILPILAMGIASFFLEIRCLLKLGEVHRLFRWAGYALLTVIGMSVSSFLAAIAFFVAREESWERIFPESEEVFVWRV